jgi:hypothetical protein
MKDASELEGLDIEEREMLETGDPSRCLKRTRADNNRPSLDLVIFDSEVARCFLHNKKAAYGLNSSSPFT